MDENIVYIDKLSELVKTVSELFYQQNNREALSVMPELLDGIMNLSSIMAAKEGMAGESSQELVKVMGDSLAAMENNDYVLLADILRYDMMDMLDRYRGMFV